MATELGVSLAQEISTSMSSCAATCLLLGAISLAMLSIAHVVAFVTIGRRPRSGGGARDGISVLKPLKGVEAELETNLAAVLAQDHPKFEVLFAAEDPSDPALGVARAVCARFPHVRTQVLVGGAPDGLNPKVRLLRKLEESAQYPFLLISDSNVRPQPSYLREVQDQQLATGAALVHCLLGSTDPQGFPDALEQIQLASWIVPTVSLSSRFEHPVVIGKSMYLSREALHRAGGFAAVRDVLAEDHILGRNLVKAGEKVALSPHILPVSNVGRGFSGFWNRYVRWGQMQKTIAPVAFVAALLVQPVPYLLVPLVWGNALERVVAGVLLAVKLVLDLWIVWRIGGHITPRLLGAWAAREGLVAPIWLVSLLSRTVSWRGQRLMVSSGSRLSPVVSR